MFDNLISFMGYTRPQHLYDALERAKEEGTCEYKESIPSDPHTILGVPRKVPLNSQVNVRTYKIRDANNIAFVERTIANMWLGFSGLWTSSNLVSGRVTGYGYRIDAFVPTRPLTLEIEIAQREDENGAVLTVRRFNENEDGDEVYTQVELARRVNLEEIVTS